MTALRFGLKKTKRKKNQIYIGEAFSSSSQLSPAYFFSPTSVGCSHF